MSRIRALLMVLPVLTLVATACAREGQSLIGIPERLEDFCTSIVDGELLASGSESDIPKALEFHSHAAQIAPQDIRPEVTRLDAQVQQGLKSENPDAILGTPSFERLEERVDKYVADNCGWRTISFTAREYRFEGFPATLSPARWTFAATNEGKEVHEFGVGRIKEGVTDTLQQIFQLPPDQVGTKIEFLNGDLVLQGDTNREVLDLSPGRYAMLCFVPVGTTTLENLETGTGPPHFARGMFVEFTVR